MRITSIVVLIFMLLHTGVAQEDWQLPETTTQLVVVLCDSETATTGICQTLEKVDDEWQTKMLPFPVVIGKNGLGWGRGLHPPVRDGMPEKREGDGKSPAGVFQLSAVFGVLPLDSLMPLAMPYVHITELLECIDDVKSNYYNQLVDNDTVAAVDWNSSEKMLQIGEPYALGVFVDHNVAPPIAGAGSCIFLHIWKNASSSTVGCTAMSDEKLVELVGWLDRSTQPLLIQLTRKQYRKLLYQWNLPTINEK
jgi:D-alanyl-D-alanine dipeptidase